MTKVTTANYSSTLKAQCLVNRHYVFFTQDGQVVRNPRTGLPAIVHRDREDNLLWLDTVETEHHPIAEDVDTANLWLDVA